MDQLLREWERWLASGRFPANAPLTTLYFGGGTPSHLTPPAIARILDAIQADRALAPGAEVTLEANPEDVTPEAAIAWAAAGINRVSLGVQSFDPGVLAWMHRTHAAAQVPRAVRSLRDAGITNLSLDLIYALPGALRRDWAADLDQALALEPEHLSLYGLTVESHTPLGRWVERGTALPTTDESLRRGVPAGAPAAHRRRLPALRGLQLRPARLPGGAQQRLLAPGSLPRAGALGPQRRRQPCGGGTSGSGRRGPGRSRPGSRTVADEEQLDAEAVRLEDLYLGLRTDRGLPLAGLPAGVIGGVVRHRLGGGVRPASGALRRRLAAVGRAGGPTGSFPS